MVLRAKFEALSRELKDQFLEREEVIDGMMNAALAGEHVLLVGAPGSAKSALVTTFAKCVTGVSYFEWLIGRFTVPEELFGPLSLKSLKEESYRRVTTSKLPEAHVAFLDEVFKGNSAILNTLLPIMNERKFYNNGKPAQLPLRMMVGASNELPEGAELAAMYDRFLVRFEVDYIDGADNWIRMMQSNGATIKAPISLDEWDAARAEVAQLSVPVDTLRELHKLRGKLLTEHNIELSDRRWKQCVKLLRSEAWRLGETMVTEYHFKALAPALWDDLAQVETVKEACEAAAGATTIEANKIVQMVKDVISKIPQPQPGEKASPETAKQMVAANQDAARGLARLKQLLVNAKTPRAKKSAQEGIASVEGAMKPMRNTMREMLEL